MIPWWFVYNPCSKIDQETMAQANKCAAVMLSIIFVVILLGIISFWMLQWLTS